ncbi:MAG: 2-hydroxychromene-2-carboxylate isomerase, partial [Rhizobiaceae bacterium]
AHRHGVHLNFKPVNPKGVWEKSGSVPLPQRSKLRQRYRFVELQRIAALRNLQINLQPAHFPVDPTLADCCAIVIQQAGNNPADYMERVFGGVWTQELDISDLNVVGGLLTDCGFDADTVIVEAQSSSIRQKRTRYTLEAANADAVGVPAFVLNGEVFWGQDRIEFIDHALTTGRAPFQAPA